MSTKGKHASGETGGFYRDLIIMVLGIILVGAAVFLILVLIADEPDGDATPPVAASTTTTTEATTTSAEDNTTTSSSTTTTMATTTTVPVRPPDEVRVQVLNSMGLAGAAGRKTAELDEAGYQTLPAADYEPQQDPSRIWYREGFSAEASQLLEYLDGALVEPLPDESIAGGADVVLVLGTGYEE